MAITAVNKGRVGFRWYYPYRCDDCSREGGVETNCKQVVGDTHYCPGCLPRHGFKVTYHRGG